MRFLSLFTNLSLALVMGFCAISTLTAAELALPADDAYVIANEEGHLSLGGERQRYWGVIFSGTGGSWGKMPSDTPEQKAARYAKMKKDVESAADRVVDMGFNLFRTWMRFNDSPWEKGDCSENDSNAYFLAQLEQRGVKVWASGLHMNTYVKDEDVALVDDPATAEAWVAALHEAEIYKNGKAWAREFLPCIWDARSEAAFIKDLRENANFQNHYKGGMRLADDPQNIVWEITNEQRWLPQMLRGQWQKYPAYFRDGLLVRWHEFLAKKYGTEDKLRTAWLNLLPGESLSERTILLTPMAGKTQVVMLGDTNPAAVAALKNVVAQAHTRDDFNRRRGEDVIEFLLNMLIDHKQRVKAALKEFGKSCALSVCLFDTGEGYNTQYTWLHQQGDAVSICTYMSGLMHDKQDKRFPWNTLLDEPPRVAWNVPWVETQRIPGKPYLVYENTEDNPSKYRAEWPYLMASLASIQDMDAVCFHLFNNHLVDSDDPERYSKRMDYSAPYIKGPEGFHHRYDEVMTSAIRGAGQIFRNDSLPPAPNPTTYTFGRRTLYDPASMDYGQAYGTYGPSVQPTTFRYGTRMLCDPTVEGDKVDGPVVSSRAIYESNPIRPAPGIEYDWHQGHLIFDRPDTKTYVGFFGERTSKKVTFSDNVTLDNVSVINPEGMIYPVTPEENYIAFSLTTRDGKPLADSKNGQISLVSTSFNSGVVINEDNIKLEYLWGRNKESLTSIGEAPALVARAGATVTAPALNGMTYVFKDWYLKPIGEGTITDGKLVIPTDKPIFIVELSR